MVKVQYIYVITDKDDLFIEIEEKGANTYYSTIYKLKKGIIISNNSSSATDAFLKAIQSIYTNFKITEIRNDNTQEIITSCQQQKIINSLNISCSFSSENGPGSFPLHKHVLS